MNVFGEKVLREVTELKRGLTAALIQYDCCSGKETGRDTGAHGGAPREDTGRGRPSTHHGDQPRGTGPCRAQARVSATTSGVVYNRNQS